MTRDTKAESESLTRVSERDCLIYVSVAESSRYLRFIWLRCLGGRDHLTTAVNTGICTHMTLPCIEGVIWFGLALLDVVDAG